MWKKIKDEICWRLGIGWELTSSYSCWGHPEMARITGWWEYDIWKNTKTGEIRKIGVRY
jgi:hypothetical protein